MVASCVPYEAKGTLAIMIRQRPKYVEGGLFRKTRL